MRQGYFYICMLIVSLGLLAGCKAKKVAMASFSDLYGEWEVVELNGKDVDAEYKRPVLNLDVARSELTGSTGCNRLMGKIENRKDHPTIIRFLQVATTRRACFDKNVEQEFLKALDQVVRFQSLTEEPYTKIAFYGADNEKLMELNKLK